MNTRAARMARLARVGAAVLLLAGCASAEAANTEQMLAAAGFRQQPANSPEWRNRMLMLPARKLVPRPPAAGEAATGEYVYADPDFCNCLWIGNAQNFQAFSQLAFQQRLARMQLQAAQIAAQPPPWGFWGPAPVVVVHTHH